MKKYWIVILLAIYMSGCASGMYGYTLEEWNSFTQQQRIVIKAEAEQSAKKDMDDRREREFTNQPFNEILGTRSNVY